MRISPRRWGKAASSSTLRRGPVAAVPKMRTEMVVAAALLLLEQTATSPSNSKPHPPSSLFTPPGQIHLQILLPFFKESRDKTRMNRLGPKPVEPS